MTLRLVRCKNCDLVYAPNPTPNDDLVAAYMTADYDSSEESKMAAKMFAGSIAEIIPNLDKSGPAVDVGTGDGALLPFLQEFGFKSVIGIEPSIQATLHASKEVAEFIIQKPFSEEIFGDSQPSLVCAFMILEHLHDPRSFVETLNKKTRMGGAIALIVHDWSAPLNRFLGSRSPIRDIEHMQLFNRKSISILLENSGYKLLLLKPIVSRYPLKYWLKLSPLPSRLKSMFLKVLSVLNLGDIKLSIDGGNFLAVGEKINE